MSKTRLNISIDHDLADFIKIYARENRTTASEVITQFILGLKRRNHRDTTKAVLSDPDFYQALQEVRARIQDGSARWHTFEEVFDE